MSAPTEIAALPKTPMRITPSFAFAYVERAIQEGLGRRLFGKAEQAAVVRHFHGVQDEPTCAYCGRNNPTRWDHVIPVRASGETVVGNMVLACSACDDSKQARPFRDWLRQRPVPDAEDRIQRIERYMAAFGYVQPVTDGDLTPAESAELHEIRTELIAVRKRVEGFIAQVSARKMKV